MVQCLYCGQQNPDHLSHCPGCGAPSHFQRRGERPGARRRFLIFFIVVALACAVLAFWLPWQRGKFYWHSQESSQSR